MEFAGENGLTINHILQTHIHADFASGSTALVAATGAQLALSAYIEGELYQYARPHRSLRSGDSVQIGDFCLEALHPRSHARTPQVRTLSDLKRLGTIAIFSGDFLFVCSLGSPDLLGESAKRSLAQETYRSVHERSAHLPEETKVHPGHGAGLFCGAGMGDVADSTLAVERLSNPLLQLSEAAFLAQILESVPPMPAYYPRMKQLNATGAPS